MVASKETVILVFLVLGGLLCCFHVVDARVDAAGNYICEGENICTFSVGTIRYCDTGCCGVYPSQYCCDGLGIRGAIILITVGSCVFVAIVIVTIYCCCKKHSDKRDVHPTQPVFVVSPSPGQAYTGDQPNKGQRQLSPYSPSPAPQPVYQLVMMPK